MEQIMVVAAVILGMALSLGIGLAMAAAFDRASGLLLARYRVRRPEEGVEQLRRLGGL